MRLPISKEIMEIEEGFMPDFNEKILELSKEKDCHFLDMTPDNDRYIYTDGNHLYKDSALEASEQIGKWIQGVSDVKP